MANGRILTPEERGEGKIRIPTPEEKGADIYGITTEDWNLLQSLPPTGVDAQLSYWFSQGHINLSNIGNIVAADIKYRAEAEQKRLDRVQREQLWQKYYQYPMALRLTSKGWAKYQRGKAWQKERVTPEYSRIFTQYAPELEGSQPWKDWFESNYSSLVAKFEASIPEFEAKYWKDKRPKEVEEEVEAGWAEWLKKKTPELKEEYQTKYPYGIQGRPWAFSPRVQTVQF